MFVYWLNNGWQVNNKKSLIKDNFALDEALENRIIEINVKKLCKSDEKLRF